MNSLVKDKLKMKPIVDPFEPIAVVLKVGPKEVAPTLKGVTIRDLRKQQQSAEFDAEELMERPVSYTHLTLPTIYSV